MDAPNGERVTNAQLYRALYDLDQGLTGRFTALHEALNGVHERTGAVEGRLTEHEKGHQSAGRTGGLAGLVAAVVAAVIAGLGDLLRH